MSNSSHETPPLPSGGISFIVFNSQKWSIALHTVFSLFPKASLFLIQEPSTGNVGRLFQQPSFLPVAKANQETLHTAIYIRRDILHTIGTSAIENNYIHFTVLTQSQQYNIANIYILE
jgi:hypothetical protein